MSDSTMRAASLVGRGKTDIIETPIPEAPVGHALVEPLLIAICGSDLMKIFHDLVPVEFYPLPPGVSGHEVIARVVSMNPGEVTDPGYPGGPVKEGDIVLALVPVVENAMSEFATATIENLLPLPPGKPAQELILAQQLGTVIYACKRLPNIVGKTAVVVGQGSAGLFFNYMLRRMGAAKVVALDLSDARLEMGKKFGATVSINNQNIDPIEAVLNEVGLAGADLVVEAVGEEETYNLLPNLVRKFGYLLYFGVPHKLRFDFDVMTWFRKVPNCIVSVNANEDPGNQCMVQALDLIAKGEVDVTPMLTHSFSFDEVGKAYELAYTREDGAGKVLVKMPAHDKYIKS